MRDSYNSDTDPDYEPSEEDASNYQSSSDESSDIETDEDVVVNKKGDSKKTKNNKQKGDSGDMKGCEEGNGNQKTTKKQKTANEKNQAAKQDGQKTAKATKNVLT